jgi:hypothetical protein
MTTKPTLPASEATGYTVVAADYSLLLQAGNYLEEVVAGTNADKIPTSAIVSAPVFATQVASAGGFTFNDRTTPFTAYGSWYRSGSHVYLYTSDGTTLWDIDPLTGIITSTALTWQTVTYTGTWVDSGIGSQSTRYRRNIDNTVSLQISVKGGTINTPAFTLPVGYRPPASLLEHGIDSAHSLAEIDVLSTGVVTPVTGSPTTYIWANIRYPLA